MQKENISTLATEGLNQMVESARYEMGQAQKFIGELGKTLAVLELAVAGLRSAPSNPPCCQVEPECQTDLLPTNEGPVADAQASDPSFASLP